jgi:hypothetical protein
VVLSLFRLFLVLLSNIQSGTNVYSLAKSLYCKRYYSNTVTKILQIVVISIENYLLYNSISVDELNSIVVLTKKEPK